MGTEVSVCDGLNYKPVLYVSFGFFRCSVFCVNSCRNIVDNTLDFLNAQRYANVHSCKRARGFIGGS